MNGRTHRRMLGLLAARLPEAGLARVADPRRSQGRRWRIGAVLSCVVYGLLTRRASLAETEALTAELTPAVRHRLGLTRRLPDTTARDLLVRVAPTELRRCLYRQVRAAHRRKALTCPDLPFGVVALDGKATALPATHGPYVQARHEAGQRTFGLVRTVTTTLLSSPGCPCLDASPIPPHDNEQTHYGTALEALCEAYLGLHLFRLVTYDAGGCSTHNARLTRELLLHYLMRVKPKSQPKLTAVIRRLLGARSLAEADAVREERVAGHRVRRSIYVAETTQGWPAWTEHRAVVRLLWEELDERGQPVKQEERYYVTSLAPSALTGAQWLRVVRGHWAVENNCHHTFDAVLQEDDRPWITRQAQGMLAVLLLRRVAYNVLTLYRSVTLRAENTRLLPWRDLCRRIYNACISATEQQLAALRARKPPDEV